MQTSPTTTTNMETPINDPSDITQNQRPCPRSRMQKDMARSPRQEPCNGSVAECHARASVVLATLGAGILVTRKGTQAHRIMGRIWTGIAVIAGLNTFRLRDPEGKLMWFHGLSTISISSAIAGVYYARTKKITRHKKLMGVAYATAALTGIAVFTSPKRVPTASPATSS
jgi:uncharacterized membrane protein